MTSELSQKPFLLPGLPLERERNILDKKIGYEYLIVVINYRPGLKFGLGIKNVCRSVFVNKIDDNSIVTGLFNITDRIIDVDGDPVYDNIKCKMLLVRALKERKMATVLIERAANEKALKDATCYHYHRLSIASRDLAARGFVGAWLDLVALASHATRSRKAPTIAPCRCLDSCPCWLLPVHLLVEDCCSAADILISSLGSSVRARFPRVALFWPALCSCATR
uniref:PDZ domain-containing protein n=1 Tax=Caenorhabditis japonica TaxID=281687 RepID=A0A8R1ILT7_CAEJA